MVYILFPVAPSPSQTYRDEILDMFLIIYLFLLLPLPSLLLCSAHVLRAIKDDRFHVALEERALPVLPDLSSLSLFNASATDTEIVQVTTSLGTSLQVFCTSVGGVQMEARSCFNAWNHGPKSEVQETWAKESSDIRADVYLPEVLISDDGTCVMSPALESGATMARASAANVSEAGRAIIQECVIKRRIGGQASNIGGDNKLLVRMGAFKPTVTCGETVNTPPSSCRYIIDRLLKTIKLEIFGRGAGRLDVSLPLTLRAPDGKCQFVIDKAGVAVAARWFDIYLNIETIMAMCLRQGQGGTASVPYRSPVPVPPGTPVHLLLVTLMDEPASSVG